MQIRNRASAVIIRDEAVLLIRREKPGETYYVFPGGAVEPGEDPLGAAFREIEEELGLSLLLDYRLGEIVGENGTNTFFRFQLPPGVQPVWQEGWKQRPDNRYAFEWVPLSAVDTVNLKPEEARADILAQLDRGFSAEVLAAAHEHSSHHREEIETSSLCGCFYCTATYPPSEIWNWVDEGTCALCPRCEIDAVIGDASGYPLEENFLRAMYDTYF